MTKPLTIWLPTIRAGSGADVFAIRLAQGLERTGHRPVLQWFAHHYELAPWRLAGVEPPEGVDVIHSGSWQGFAFKRPGIPLVITEHQYVRHPAFVPYRGVTQMLYHRLMAQHWMDRSYAQADAIVAVSEFCAEPMRRDLRREITVIHNWIDLKSFVPIPKKKQAGATELRRFNVLVVGNPSRWKGTDLLPVIADRLGSTFQISYLGGLRKSLKESSLPENVVLLPRCSNEQMPAIYQSVDAVLILARYEAFGYVALEAMACGKPVIGFDVAGVAEICKQGETALLAPLNDVSRVTDLVRYLAFRPELGEKLGAAGRRRAEALFGEQAAVNAYLNVYSQVLRRQVHDEA